MSAHQTLSIGGMTCAACVSRVEKVLMRVPGVEQAQVNLVTGKASVTAGAGVGFAALVAAVERAGYSATPESDAAQKTEPLWPVLVAAAFTAPIVLPMLLQPMGVPMLPGWVQAVLAAPVQIWLGWHFVTAGWKSVRAGSASMDVLVAIGTWAAFLLSLYGLWAAQDGMAHLYFESSALVITLVLLGRFLEGHARLQTGAAIRALAGLRPDSAIRRRDGADTVVKLSQVAVGDLLVVKPGARFAVDGVVVEGSGSVDEAHLTGESMPVEKAPGSAVMAGGINGASLLVVRTERIGAETVLGRMVRLVEDAQLNKPQVQKLADRISAVFVPVVLALALLTLVVWLVLGAGLAASILNAVSVLVIACPCALGLATPAAIMAGTGVAARFGILIRDTDVLGHAKSIRAVVFDKTGTLTEGHPRLVEWHGDDTTLELAAALQQGSAHPLARAVLAASAGKVAVASGVRDLPGQGVEGTVGGRVLRLGNAALLAEAGIGKGALAAAEAGLMQGGRTLAWLIEIAPVPQVIGLLAFADTIKPGAKDAVAVLKARGLRTVLLSGDNEGSVAAMAAEAGLDEWQAGVMPADKAAFVSALRKTMPVAMVGDGINDAPALAEADIGMAMGEGTDIAMQTAGITLMRGDPGLVAAALDISRLTQARVWQGLAWAFGFNAIGLPLAALGYLSPVVSGGAMAFSSVAVVLNAVSLRRWKP
eukprot:gene13515-13634_t